MKTVLLLCLWGGINQTPPPPRGSDTYARSVARVARMREDVANLRALIKRLKAAGNLPADRNPDVPDVIPVRIQAAEDGIRRYEGRIKAELQKQGRWIGRGIASAF